MEDRIRTLKLERDKLLSKYCDNYRGKINQFYNRRITSLKRYGVEYPLQSKEVREKIIKTNLKKYGSKSILGNKDFRRKYNIDTNFQNFDVRRKTRQISIRKYRTSHPQQSPLVKAKIKRTNLLRYGTLNGKGKRIDV